MRTGDPGSGMWAEACALIERAERLQRQFFQPGLSAARAAGWEPPIDILESERELYIIAALPGVEPHDLELSVEADVLTIGGRRRLPAALRRAAILRLEIPHGRFERRIRLPAEGVELTRSELVSGCLFLTLVKRL
jgi:HSP20 family protein